MLYADSEDGDGTGAIDRLNDGVDTESRNFRKVL